MKSTGRTSMTRRAVFFACLALVVAIGAAPVHAQQFQVQRITHPKMTGRPEIGGLYGYQWGGDFTVYTGYVDISGNDNFQVMLDWPVPGRHDVKVEVSYSRMKAATQWIKYPSGLREDLFDVAFEYYQIGGVYGYERGSVVPFGLVTVGAMRSAPEVDRYQGYVVNDSWSFAMTLGLGVKTMMTDRVGLRLQGRLLLPFVTTSGGVWFGTGGGGVAVSAGSAFIQGDVGVGLFILF